MTKTEYLESLQKIYRIANFSDSDHPDRADWLDSRACFHQCSLIDQMLRNLVDSGTLTREEANDFISTL